MLLRINIPQLYLWAEQYVESIKSCRVQLKFYSPIGRTACSHLHSLYNTTKSLLPVWALHSVQCLSTCRLQLNIYYTYGPYRIYTPSVHVHYRYTSSPPMDRRDYTEPQGCTVQLYICSIMGRVGLT